MEGAWREMKSLLVASVRSVSLSCRIMQGLRYLTGAAPMFPRWTFGYWQSNEAWRTQEVCAGLYPCLICCEARALASTGPSVFVFASLIKSILSLLSPNAVRTACFCPCQGTPPRSHFLVCRSLLLWHASSASWASPWTA